jgi:large subunit ribosomal protein L21
MYAIIRAGGKQAKVQSGDVIDIERVKGDATELTFEPLLVVDDDGNALSDAAKLAKATVSAKVLGESQGPKIDIFKYKNKTGYRRRQGHRQKYTRIEITGIKFPGSTEKKASTSKKKTEAPSKKTEAPSKTTEAPSKKPAASTKKTEAAAGKKPAASTKKTKAAASEEE